MVRSISARLIILVLQDWTTSGFIYLRGLLQDKAMGNSTMNLWLVVVKSIAAHLTLYF